jgi:polyphosphate kinase
MERNLDRRVETLFPINDPDIRHWMGNEFLGAYLADTQRARLLQYDGKWTRVTESDVSLQRDCQQFFARVATME